MNLSQDNEDRKENYMDVDESAKQMQQVNPNAMEIEPNNNGESATPKREGKPQVEQFNSIENSAEDKIDAKNLVNESDEDEFEAQMEKLKRVNNDTLRCEYPGCEKIFIGKSRRFLKKPKTKEKKKFGDLGWYKTYPQAGWFYSLLQNP